MNFNNKWFWWGIGVILIVLGLALKPVNQPRSNQMTTLTASPTLPQAAEQTAVPSVLSVTSVAPTVVLVVPTPTPVSGRPRLVKVSPSEGETFENPSAAAATDESAVCLAGLPVVESASVWLTTNGHTFATASERVFPSGISLTGKRMGNFCQTTQSGPFGPEWVQVP